MKCDSFSWYDIFCAALVLLILVVPSVFIASMLIPHVSAIEINPSVDNQPFLCKYSFSKWICDMQKPGPAGTMGEPGLMNQTFNLTANMTAGPQGLPGTGINNLTAGLNMSAIVILGDDNGQTNLSIRNASNGQVAYIDSFGNMAINNSLLMKQGAITGSSADNGDLVLNGTSSTTKTTSYVNIQLGGGITTIGAGTTTPPITAQLKVQRGSSGTNVYFYSGDASSDTNLYIANSTNAKYLIRYDRSPAGFSITKMNPPYSNFVINESTGYTGINSPDLLPTMPLQVTGIVRLDSYGVGVATFDSGGNITSVSDAKYKTNVQPYTNGLSKILQLNPVTYNWKPESGLATGDLNVGLIANEVKTVMPEAVFSKPDVYYEQVLTKPEVKDAKSGEVTQEAEYTTVEKPVLDKDGKQSVTMSYSQQGIIDALINSVKELNAKIEAQNQTIAKQEARIAALEKKVGL